MDPQRNCNRSLGRNSPKKQWNMKKVKNRDNTEFIFKETPEIIPNGITKEITEQTCWKNFQMNCRNNFQKIGRGMAFEIWMIIADGISKESTKQ